MTTVLTPDVGRIWIPSADSLTIGPAFPTGRRRAYAGVVTTVVRPGRLASGDPTDTPVQKSFGVIGLATEGLHRTWGEREDLQRLFAKPEHFERAVARHLFTGAIHPAMLTGRDAPRQMAVWHNERGQYGGRLMAKLAFGFVSSPTNSGVAVPTFCCVNKTSTFTTANQTWAKCGGSQSLSDGIANVGATVTTNEFTANGLSRATGTLSAYADPTALDGVYTGTIAKTMTVITGAVTFYGVALCDNTTGAFNLFAESAQTSATLQISDTLSQSWAISA